MTSGCRCFLIVDVFAVRLTGEQRDRPVQVHRGAFREQVGIQGVPQGVLFACVRVDSVSG